jgi:hypothetical protein
VLQEIEAEMRNRTDVELRNTPPPPEPPAPGPTVTTEAPASTTLVAAPRRHRRALTGAGIGLGVVGILALGGGVTAGVLANNTANDLTNLDKGHGVFDPGKDSLYGTERTLEGALLGVGGALTVAGVVLVVVGRR